MLRLLAACLVATTLAAGCSDPPRASADCDLSLRTGGVVYTQRAVLEAPGTRAGTAEITDCEDVGEDARGAVFPEDPDVVDTWTFAGATPDEALGVRIGGGAFQLYVAEDADVDEVLARLAQSPG